MQQVNQGMVMIAPQAVEKPRSAPSSAELQHYVYDWLKWCATRKYYMGPGAKNILARMQPSRVGQAPDARNDADMQFFNMAIHTLADMESHKANYACFQLYYCEQAKNIKRVADSLSVERTTYYRRRDAFTRAAISMAGSLRTATEAIRAQVIDAGVD